MSNRRLSFSAGVLFLLAVLVCWPGVGRQRLVAAAEMPDGEIPIILALWGEGDHTADVTARVRSLLKSASEPFLVNYRTFDSDPLPGKGKQLVVTYTFHGIVNTLTIPGGQKLGYQRLIDHAADPAGLRLEAGPVVRWAAADGGNSHFYRAVAVSEGITWDDAQAWAAGQRGYLATIGSEAENDFVFRLIDDGRFWSNNRTNSVGPFLGGIKSADSAAADQGWQWVHDEGPFTYTNWGPGQPDNSKGAENRVHFYVNGKKDAREPVWNDTPANATARGFVVEFDRSPSPALLEAVTFAFKGPPQAVLGQQQLTPEQMAGIVLIEGDKGVATGFIARVHDTECVVTNLHVLGDNQKLTIKNLQGDVVAVQGIIGAVGADIALLRLAKPTGEPPSLVTADDVLQAAQIGDKVVVVGNRLGGGVATQTAGQVKGIGPARVEVDAAFQPGNSGSPIFDLGSRKVVGVATYAETIALDALGNPVSSSAKNETGLRRETRWFGYRLDSVAKWETIEWTKWRAQIQQITEFREVSLDLLALVQGQFSTTKTKNPRLRTILARFEPRAGWVDAAGKPNFSSVPAEQVRSMVRAVRGYAEEGAGNFADDQYYDYFRTSLYWGTSVPVLVKFRSQLVQALKDIDANLESYEERLRQ
jgi:hypothetical protein